MNPDIRNLFLLLLYAAGLFSLNAGGYDLWPPDEPRYAEIAREMYESGDYLVPRVNGDLYYEKPPLLFWSIAAFNHLLGGPGEWSARLPSILSALYVVALVFLLARRMFNAQVAFWAALVLITCFRFWYQARRGQIDIMLTACMITSLYAFWRWDSERRGAWLATAYAAIGAGMLAKGPPALVFPLLFLFAFYWRQPEARKKTRWAVGSLGAIGLVLLWYVPARMAGAETATDAVQTGIGGNLLRNTIGRFVLGVSKAQPPWYYLETLPVDLLPWTFIAPPVLFWAWKQRKSSRAMWALYCWLVPALVFFSISIGKRELYLLPLLPVFAIVFGAAIVHLRETANFRWMRRGAIVWSGILLLLAAAPAAMPFSPFSPEEPLRVYSMSAAAGISGLAGLLLLLRNGGGMAPGLIAAQVGLVYAMAVCTVYPEINVYKSARPICEPARRLAEIDNSFRLYSVGFSREEYVYYSQRLHQPIFTSLIGDIPPDRLIEQAQIQKEARKVIAEAVEDVPIQDLARITPEERDALLAAINSAVDEHEHRDTILEFEHALMDEIDRFFAEFTRPESALAFIQEEDWRWLVPLYDDGDVPVHILVDRPVGSRHVLLLANESALTLLRQTSDVVSD
ncbi:MAG: glycosyltransferase family 39 protein [Candidatus Hydrogenedentes bacterium]|nr:glycosyltransferase family 39 protein [Candidatus Hydrogenedentota bacterium]